MCWADTDCGFAERIPSKIITKTQSWNHLLDFLFVYFLQLFAYLPRLMVWKKNSDMVHGFHWDQREKMHSWIAINFFLYHVEIHGPCQTQLIFSICFLSLLWHHGSKIEQKPKMKRLEIWILKIWIWTHFLPKLLMQILQFMVIKQFPTENLEKDLIFITFLGEFHF